MAAGLAHELNNPAAAAQRAAAQMAEALEVIASALGHFVEAGVERSGAETLLALQREALAGAESRTALDTLDAADAEDELLERLEALDVPEPWRTGRAAGRRGRRSGVARHASSRRPGRRRPPRSAGSPPR